MNSAFEISISEITEPTIRFDSSIAASISSGIGPELPIQVVHPYPTLLNPSAAKSSSKPLFVIFSYHSRTWCKRSFYPWFNCQSTLSCFSASSPAASITPGFEVLVQEVIAAITTSP